MSDKNREDLPAAPRWGGTQLINTEDERPENADDLGRFSGWQYPSSSPESKGELDDGTHDKERGYPEDKDA